MKQFFYFLGFFVLQIVFVVVLILILFGLVFSAFSSSQDSPGTSFSRGLVFIIAPLIVFGILIASGVWVYKDAKKFVNQGVEAWTPVGWLLAVLLAWCPALSIYLTLRKFNYKPKLLQPNRLTQ